MLTHEMFKDAKRISFLDGLRGIAILLVIAFHAYAGFPQLVRYGNEFSWFPVFKYGFLGVNLFFIISGFVILMTLEKCRNFTDFMYRRWIRLFPAMLIISLLVFCTAAFFPERPSGSPSMRDLLPGITFIQPAFWAKILGSPQGQLDGAFWSLYVEVKFYIIFGVLFFLLGSNQSILGLLVLFSLSVFRSGSLVRYVGAQHMGWFAAGALFYKYYKSSNKIWLIAGFLTALASALSLKIVLGTAFAAIGVGVIFAWTLTSSRLQSFLSSRLFLFLGFISYPLYLIHQNMMVSLIVKMGRWMPQMPDILLPVLPIMVVVGISWLVAVYVEPIVRKWIRFCFDCCRQWGCRLCNVPR